MYKKYRINYYLNLINLVVVVVVVVYLPPPGGRIVLECLVFLIYF